MRTKATGFYLAGFADNRKDKKTIGQLVPFSPDALQKSPAPVPADLDGGIQVLEGYLKQNAPFGKDLHPVIIKVSALNVNEIPISGSGVDGKVDLVLSFHLKTGDDLSVKLVDYKGSSHYTRKFSQPDAAEPVLRNVLENAIVYFNNWLTTQADTNPLLAKRVKLLFTDYKDKVENDTIYYDKLRPLKWDDFQDKLRPGNYSAQVMPGIGYTEKTWIEKGIIYVQIAVKTFVPKSTCSVKPGYQDSYNLNHEQRHFDLEKIISERFKKKLLAAPLPVMNYDGTINVEYLETLHEAYLLQQKYDNETRHGADGMAQEKWNKYIEEELIKTAG
ncbi:hypothetical protein MUY27_11230 [Mucilaginibacter sp. RS28]|uniref:Uncharacterized protein n=1 Tax=Mucilaginibacter straminoryzae TaxID=2932774 RepID=A0A9X1X3K6_9SPHI|nr:hypothetical protein [Mucilaginibacter straminoryzae]MCJ8210281.1 hypothetical protein [Mucilaginibacter straminoryzae]